ncbi:STAS domain-containing protein [Vibrio hippocampi]|uniref:Anti-sigma factor antagonist n=1 Tax=Vibrio hippocampi TaxID=654686 RepID=A0ABM8ZMZ9_9VIBR|nr:STAS domain-containing protein [Vibrio hippocampi]CAH0529954.1 hypothetical protein VHP8226_03684 [Vibrio hippocampi]
MQLVKSEISTNTLNINVIGDLDAKGCRDIQPSIDELISSDTHQEIEVDLHQVRFMDSSGIGAIVYLYKRLVEQQRTMRLENVEGQPLKIITLLRIGQAIPVNIASSNEYL